MNTTESNSEVIDDLLKSPERNFAKLLFETPPLAVIEILSDLVLHPDNGHNATIQCLYVWQDLQNNPYTLSSILEEIQTTCKVEIISACLVLINRLIQHAPDLMKRIQIRRELEEIQFEEHLLAVSNRLLPNEQLKSAVEKFTFLLRQPSSTVTRVPTIVDVNCTAETDSGTFSSEEEDVMNGTIDEPASNGTVENKQNGKIASEINTLISTFESDDALELLAKFLKQLQVAKQPPTTVLKQLNDNFSKLSETPSASKPASIPPPPPPLLMPNAKKGPPAAPSLPSTSKGPPVPPPLLKSNGAVPPPPMLGQNPTNSINKAAKVEVPNALKPKFVPPDGKKLRHLQWTKIPINNLTSTTNTQNSSNVWLKMGTLNTDMLKNLDFAQLDSYFGCEVIAPDAQSINGNEKENKSLTVSLLCGRKSLSVNVYLRSLKGMIDEIIAYIKSGKSTEDDDVEKLRMLVPLLPTEEEVQTLNNYTGNRDELGTAECFLLQLLAVSDYKLRIESIILREEFGSFISTIEPDLRTIILACQELRQSRNLQTILLILLHMGNYLNHNGALGNAVGFKLNSLWKIDEMRAVKGGRTFLHLITQQSEKVNANLDDISHVEDAAKLAFEALKSELKTSVDRVNRLENQLKTKNDTFFNEMKTFLSTSKQSLSRSNDLLTQIENERQQLAVYFCENEKTFSLEELFKIFSNFRSRFIIASNENRQREEGEKRMQEKNNPVKIDDQVPTINKVNITANNDTIKSPSINRRASVIVEQDRDRNSIPSVLQSRRKSSAARKDSAIFDRFNFDRSEKDNQSSSDLGSFMDQALEQNNSRRISRLSPLSSPLPKLQEFRETTNTINENKEMDEVKVAVPTINSKLSESIVNENTKPIGKSDLLDNKTRVTSASLVNSIMTKKAADDALTTKQSPPLSRRTPTQIKPITTNGPTYTKTTLRKVPATTPSSPLQKQPSIENKEASPGSPYRKHDISRIRARQSNEPTQKPQPTTTPIQPLRPSQVRLAQAKPPTRSTLTAQSSTTSNSSGTSRLSSINSSRLASKVDPKPVSSITSSTLRRTPITSRPSPTTTNTPTRPLTNRTTTTNKDAPANRTAMSAAEKRNLFRQNTSLSTTSRPTLIRCGSKTDKPRWS